MFTAMEVLRVRMSGRGGMLSLAVAFLCCAGSVQSFGQSQDSEFTFLLPAGRSECFYQTALKNGTMEVEYQVNAWSVKAVIIVLTNSYTCTYKDLPLIPTS